MCDPSNLCEMYGDHFQPEWELDNNTVMDTDTSHATGISETASSVRTALSQYLLSN